MLHSRIAAPGVLTAVAVALAAGLAAPARGQSEPDVDALASQLNGEAGLAVSRIQFSGFGDVSYKRIVLSNQGSLLGLSLPRHGGFAVGNLNLYMDAPIGNRARAFVEVKYSYLPNGVQSATPDLTGTFPRQSTLAVNIDTSEQWGGIVIERAFVEYGFGEKLAIRAGQFLTPYGVWNVDHGSPAIVSVQVPYVVGQELIPARQVGLEAFGRIHLGDDVRLGYHATASNGRIGDTAQYLDYDGRLGWGGRLFVETERIGSLKAGVSGYGGRYTNARNAIGASGLEEKVIDQWDEMSLGADLHWRAAGLDLAGEVVWNDRKYRANLPVRPDGTPFDRDARWGGYAVAGYALPFLRQVMPYAKGEFYRGSTELHALNVPDILLYSAGINTHLLPGLVIKLEVEHATFRGTHQPPYDSLINGYLVQTAFAF